MSSAQMGGGMPVSSGWKGGYVLDLDQTRFFWIQYQPHLSDLGRVSLPPYTMALYRPPCRRRRCSTAGQDSTPEVAA
ncbi:hypothetical protein FKM82_026759 [Ascaphus truei]